MDETVVCISNVEDTVNSGKDKTNALAKQVTLLTNKLDDLENRSRRSNLPLVNVPEKVEGADAVAFPEKWLPEALTPAIFPKPLLIKRAHRLPDTAQSIHQTKSPHCELFKLNLKGKVMCGDQEIMFFPDLSTELHQQRRCFDRVKQQIRSLNICDELFYPAKL